MLGDAIARRAMSTLIALSLLVGCEAVQDLTSGMSKPTARVTDARLSDLSLDAATLDFDVEVKNPYSVPLPLVNVDYDLGSAGRSLVAGSAPLTGTIPAGGARTVTLPASLRFADVLSALGSVRPGAVVPYELGATLSVDAPAVGAVSLPLSKSGELPVPAVPEVELLGVDWQNLSLSDASAVLRLRVKNLNDFEMNLRQLDYGLSLGGTRVADAGVKERKRFKRGQAQVLEIPVSIRPSDLGMAAFGMLQGSDATYDIGGMMSFTTPYGPLELPFDRSGRTPFSR